MNDTGATAQDHYLNTSLGEIARSVPGATTVFRRHRLDFCCGGAASLSDAAAARGIDAAGVVRELRDLAASGATAPDLPATPVALAAHIVARYHDVHRAELPELIRLATKVERVHADHPQVPKGLSAQIETMFAELTEHMAKEETILFPMMGATGAPLSHPIARMRQEHDSHGRELQRVLDLTADLALPDDACNTWRALYLGLRKFADDLVDHIHTENNILFPTFEHI